MTVKSDWIEFSRVLNAQLSWWARLYLTRFITEGAIWALSAACGAFVRILSRRAWLWQDRIIGRITVHASWTFEAVRGTVV